MSSDVKRFRKSLFRKAQHLSLAALRPVVYIRSTWEVQQVGKKTPAQIVADMFGVRKLAKALGLTPGAVTHWKDKGLIPSKHHEKLLELAKEKRLRLTAEMLVCGA
jgi:hypothetical protein